MKKIITLLWTLCLPVILISCGSKSASTPSARIAMEFMESYYVKTDLVAAQKYADGMALDKILASQKLVEGQAIDATTKHPKISYRLVSSQAADQEAAYIFDVVIKLEGMDEIKQTTRVRVRKREGDQWKVTQFSDFSSNSNSGITP